MTEQKNIVVVYPGRFQPWHVGHYNTFKSIEKQFPTAQIFIGTSNKVDETTSPFNFEEKKLIITTMFPELSGKIVEVRNPYAATEILSKFPEDTSYVTVVSKKDSKRLGGKYFKPFVSIDAMNGYKDNGYVWVTSKNEGSEKFKGTLISGSLVRNLLGHPSSSIKDKISLFKTLYGSYNKTIFDLMVSKISIDASEHYTFNQHAEQITEGGAFGHLAHPYEEINMSFDQMQKMIVDVLDNNLEYNVEKTDGQNLLISYKNNRVVAARNKSHLKNSGENALDINGIQNMFAGRGDIELAFVSAMDNLSAALNKISNEKLLELFEEGKNFITLEVIYPKSTNVIPYGHSLLVLQGMIEHDIAGNPLEYSREKANQLVSLIREVNSDIQKEFKIVMQPSVQMPVNTAKLKNKYSAILKSIKTKHNLHDSSQLKDYMTLEWNEYLNSVQSKMGIILPEDIRTILINRWVHNLKTPNIRVIKKMIGNDKVNNWITSFEKKEIKKVQKEIRKPFEMLFLKLGADILSSINSVLTIDHNKSTEAMRERLRKVIDEIRDTKDPDKIDKLELELNRLESMGGFDQIVPIEGIVFSKNNTLYKLTGTFAAVNQILGILKYA